MQLPKLGRHSWLKPSHWPSLSLQQQKVLMPYVMPLQPNFSLASMYPVLHATACFHDEEYLIPAMPGKQKQSAQYVASGCPVNPHASCLGCRIELSCSHAIAGASARAQPVLQSPGQTQQRRAGISLEYDDGDSVWLPQLTGGYCMRKRPCSEAPFHLRPLLVGLGIMQGAECSCARCVCALERLKDSQPEVRAFHVMQGPPRCRWGPPSRRS